MPKRLAAARAGIDKKNEIFAASNLLNPNSLPEVIVIPALAAASLLGIYNIYKEGSAELNFLAIIAVIFSFIFSYITIVIFLNFIKKFSLKIFVIYRIVLSILILTIVYL